MSEELIKCDYCGDMVDKSELAWTAEETGCGNYCWDNCYDEIVYCSACNDHKCRSELCWHVFEHPDSGEIMGAGGDPSDFKYCKDSVINILTILGKEFAGKLKTAIEKQAYKIRCFKESFRWSYQRNNEFFSLEENGQDYYPLLAEKVFNKERIAKEDMAIKYELGIDWLSSLDKGKTLEGEQATIRWIDEYLTGAQNERATTN